jgi:hypothetical protein
MAGLRLLDMPSSPYPTERGERDTWRVNDARQLDAHSASAYRDLRSSGAC